MGGEGLRLVFCQKDCLLQKALQDFLLYCDMCLIVSPRDDYVIDAYGEVLQIIALKIGNIPLTIVASLFPSACHITGLF